MTKLRYNFFFIFIILNTYVLLILHAKIQPKIPSGSGEETTCTKFDANIIDGIKVIERSQFSYETF